MHSDPEPGHQPSFLPPFVAREPESGRPGRDARPLPPWSSAGRDLGGAADAPDAAETAAAGPWTPAEAGAAPEPWLEAPEPSGGGEAPFTASEPWPGDEVEEPAATDAWTPDSDPEEDPWATAGPATGPEPFVLDTPEPGEDEPVLVLDDEDDEPFVLDDAMVEKPLAFDEQSVPGDDPWLQFEQSGQAEAAPRAGSADDDAPLRGEAVLDGAEPVPGDVAPGWPAGPERPAVDLPPAPTTPLEELVETAGRALAGTGLPWEEPPLSTWPGEAEAWDASAVGSTALTPEPESGEESSLAVEMAEHLERLAADLRVHGTDALRQPSGDALGLAMASFLAGWRAARGDD